MIKKIEHIGIAVEDIDTASKIYQNLLDSECYKTEVVETEFVKTAFFKVGNSKIELLQSTKPGSVIDRFLTKNGQGFHHIAFEVDDLEIELERLQKLEFELIHKSPKPGADHKIIAFLHPKSTTGMLIELCQEIK